MYMHGGCKAGANNYSGGVVSIFILVTTFLYIKIYIVFFCHPDILRCGKLTDLEVTAP